MKIRALQKTDRLRLEEIIHSTDNFNQADAKIAMELIDDAIHRGDASDYIVDVLEDEAGLVLAYVCFGLTPLTDHTFDFYWMVVDSKYQGRGIGVMLFQHVESQVRSRGGKLLMCETSSLEGYSRVVLMYEKLGYQFVTRIKDFYRTGDDKIIYMKYMT